MCNCFIFRSLAIPPYCWIMSLCLYFLIHPLQSLSWAPFFKRRIRCPCITSFLSSQPPGGFIIITVPSWSVSLLVILLTADAVLKLCLFNPKFLNPNTLATWCEERTHLKRSWCWEGLGAGGEGADRGWDGWMASRTRWRWVWVNCGRWWWTRRPGVLRFMASQRVWHDWATELNWTELSLFTFYLLICFPVYTVSILKTEIMCMFETHN